MITRTMTIRENRGYSNYPVSITIQVDEPLNQALDAIENGKRDSKNLGDREDWLYYRKVGTMSQDKGFNAVNRKTGIVGQTAGMFYGGIPTGVPYLDLRDFRDGGVYTFNNLLCRG